MILPKVRDLRFVRRGRTPYRFRSLSSAAIRTPRSLRWGVSRLFVPSCTADNLVGTVAPSTALR
jgi:hypothetical protein